MSRVYTIMFFCSLALFAVSVAALAFYGLNFGVDFRGGSVMEIEFTKPSLGPVEIRRESQNEETGGSNQEQKIELPPILELQAQIKAEFPDLDISLNPSGEKGLIMRTSEISEDSHQKILEIIKLNTGLGIEEKRFDSVGPAIGKELRNKSFTALGIMLATIACYITFVFRKLSRTLSLLAMNISTLVALLHDIIIPMGIFAVLGHFYNIQISAVFVAAALTILGYTVSDKVVIFDRVRENILKFGKGKNEDLGTIVHRSVMQTLVRSINNTLTVVLSSAAIYLFGGESIRYFALALMIGIFLGAYSSIFVASPLLVWGSKWRK